MPLDISVTESVSLTDKLLAPVKLATKLTRRLKSKITSPNSLSVNVPDNLNVQDKMGTYKPWFNGMKHFDTVKTLPAQKKKTVD